MENIKSYKNNKFKTYAQTWNNKFELPDVSHTVSDIQDYFDYFIKKHETVTDNPPIRTDHVLKVIERVVENM